MSLEHSLGIKFAGFGLSKAKADTSKLPYVFRNSYSVKSENLGIPVLYELFFEESCNLWRV